jgi:hypothetical protein
MDALHGFRAVALLFLMAALAHPSGVAAQLLASATDSQHLSAASGVHDVRDNGAACDGVTDDSPAVAAAARDGGRVVIPPNCTLKITSTWDISRNGMEVEGSGDTSVIQPFGSTSFHSISASGKPASDWVKLARDASEGSQALTLVARGAASAGIRPGDFLWLQDAAFSSQVVRVRSVSNNEIVLDDTLLRQFTTNAGSQVMRLAPLVGVRIHNLKIDGAHLSGPDSDGVVLEVCVYCEVSGVTAVNTTGAAVAGSTDYGSTFAHLLAENAGRNGSTAAFNFWRISHSTFDDIKSFRTAGNGFQLQYSVGNHLMNITVMGSPATGRAWKYDHADYNQATSIWVEGATRLFNGINITASSSHNRFVNCAAMNNSGAGIATFGNGNHFNSFVGCTSKYNTGNAFWTGRGDNSTSVIGGEFGAQRGKTSIITASGDDFQLVGARLVDDRAVAIYGLDFDDRATGAMVAGNIFEGLPPRLDIRAAARQSMFALNHVPDGIATGGHEKENSYRDNYGGLSGAAASDLNFSASPAFPVIPAHACAEQVIAAPGALPGNAIAESWPAAMEPGLFGNMRVANPDQVTVRLCNASNVAVRPVTEVFGGRILR